MEGEDDGDRDDGHVHGEAQVAEEGALVGAVVAGVRGLVLEEQGAEEGPREEGGRAGRTAAAAAWAGVAVGVWLTLVSCVYEMICEYRCGSLYVIMCVNE